MTAWKRCSKCGGLKSPEDFYPQRPDCKECKKAQVRAYYRTNPEQTRERHRAYNAANREKRIAYLAEWRRKHGAAYYQKNRAKLDARTIRRRKLKAGVVVPVDRAEIYEREGGRCHICHRPVSRRHFTLDHLVPLALGGEHSPANVRLAHHRCNVRMGVARMPAQLILVEAS